MKQYVIHAVVNSEYDLIEPSGGEAVETGLEGIDTELTIQELTVFETGRMVGYTRRRG